jgi:hypothetical protein
MGTPRLIVNATTPVLTVVVAGFWHVTRSLPPPGVGGLPWVGFPAGVPEGPAEMGSTWPVLVPFGVDPMGSCKPHVICANAMLLIAKITPITKMGIRSRLNVICFSLLVTGFISRMFALGSATETELAAATHNSRVMPTRRAGEIQSPD